MARTVAVFSLGGAPGVTTFAMALASVWPGKAGAVLLEADAAGGDIAAWRRLPTSPGLVDLAAAARHEQTPGAQALALLAHAQTLPGGLPVCVAPATAERAGGAVRLLSQHPRVLAARTGPAAVMDLGRLVPRSPTAQLAVAADTAVLLVHDDLAQLRRVKEAAAALAAGFGELGLVVRDGRDSDTEIAQAVELPVWGRVPTDAKGAAFVRGERAGRRPGRWPLLNAAAALARRLADGGATASAVAGPPAAVVPPAAPPAPTATGRA
ncbi:MAG: hypothetical protein M0026_12500 [Nocardiopsaceae bacterium]|nr:hypothetical protein [Nocardiopsaceae bacterium]